MFFGDKVSTKSASGYNKKSKSKNYGITIISSGCHFQGKLYCKGASRIAGKLEGEINSEGMLVIEEGAVIHADITTEEIVIHGSVTGSLIVKNKVELSSSSRFVGDIKSPCLVIQEGARFDGRSSTNTEQERQEDSVIEELHPDKSQGAAL